MINFESLYAGSNEIPCRVMACFPQIARWNAISVAFSDHSLKEKMVSTFK